MKIKRRLNKKKRNFRREFKYFFLNWVSMCCVKIVFALLPLGLCCLLPDMNSQDRPFSSVLPVAPPLTHRVSNWSFFSWKKTHTDSESWHLFDVEPQLIFIAVFNFYTDHKKIKEKMKTVGTTSNHAVTMIVMAFFWISLSHVRAGMQIPLWFSLKPCAWVLYFQL